MDELRQLDEVAYVRFASVYRHFEDVEAFHEEIQRLRSQRSPSQPIREIKRVLKREPGPNRDQLPLLPMESPRKTESSGATPSTETGAAKNTAATESADESENKLRRGDRS
jgi:hypothetical protein